MVIEHSCPLVATSRVPRVCKAELLEVEMVTELVAQGAQKSPERRDLLPNRRPHPSRATCSCRACSNLPSELLPQIQRLSTLPCQRAPVEVEELLPRLYPLHLRPNL